MRIYQIKRSAVDFVIENDNYYKTLGYSFI